jgi:hypothetical protein
VSAEDDLDLSKLGEIPDPLEGAGAQAPIALPEALGASPTRADARRRRLVAVTAAAAWVVGVVVILGLRGDLGHGATRTVVQIVLPAVFGAAVIVTALSAGPAGLGSRTTRLVGSLAVAATLFPLAALLGSGVLLDDHPGMLGAIATCFALVVLLGGVPLLALSYGLRRSFAANAQWRSVLVAAGAGLFGAAALGTHCSTHCGLHMAAGHALPAILLAFVGGALLGRVTRA